MYLILHLFIDDKNWDGVIVVESMIVRVSSVGIVERDEEVGAKRRVLIVVEA